MRYRSLGAILELRSTKREPSHTSILVTRNKAINIGEGPLESLDFVFGHIDPSRPRLALIDAHATGLKRFKLAPELPLLIF